MARLGPGTGLRAPRSSPGARRMVCPPSAVPLGPVWAPQAYERARIPVFLLLVSADSLCSDTCGGGSGEGAGLWSVRQAVLRALSGRARPRAPTANTDRQKKKKKSTVDPEARLSSSNNGPDVLKAV